MATTEATITIGPGVVMVACLCVVILTGAIAYAIVKYANWRWGKPKP